jgi:catechol 2,3-dioxygenase-like lactoylglutathione lyase family enzyme
MSDSQQPGATPTPDAVVVPCSDLNAAIAWYTQQRGFRLDMIMPADAPRIALVTNSGITLRLEGPAQSNASEQCAGNLHDFAISRSGENGSWPEGRAGMQYRDLIPGRIGGRVIASHIRIPDGGPVADYVHFHKVGFQMIYCRRGWVRVVYEDQGPPFVMLAGDCVLQPPTIRHRVLESSPGLEVIEIGCPAVHETWRDHDIELPTSQLRPERVFGGQRFVHHLATTARWEAVRDNGFEFRDTGIDDATDNLADVRVLRATSHISSNSANAASRVRDGHVVFLFVLEGELHVSSDVFGAHALQIDDACVIPDGANYTLDAVGTCEVLEVVMNFASSPT